MSELQTDYMQQILNVMPKKVRLYHVDQREMPLSYINEFVDKVDRGDKKGVDMARRKMLGYAMGVEDVTADYIDEMTKKASVLAGLTTNQFELALTLQDVDWYDNVIDILTKADTSNPLDDMLYNTTDVTVLMRYKRTDFEGVMEALHINPADYGGTGVYRGEPIADYEKVKREYDQEDSYLTLVFTLSARDIVQYRGVVEVPAGARIGFFCHLTGRVSKFVARLEKDTVISTGYDGWSMHVAIGDFNLGAVLGGYQDFDCLGRVIHTPTLEGL